MQFFLFLENLKRIENMFKKYSEKVSIILENEQLNFRAKLP